MSVNGIIGFHRSPMFTVMRRFVLKTSWKENPNKIPPGVYIEWCDLVECRGFSVQEVRHIVTGIAPRKRVVSIGLKILVDQAELPGYIEAERQLMPSLDP